MKPTELLKFKVYNRKGREYYDYEARGFRKIENDDFRLDLRGYASERRKLEEYQNQDCVVAYVKNCLGLIILIRTAKDFMGYIITEHDFRGYTLFRMDLKEIYKYFNYGDEQENHKLNVVEQELYKRFIAVLGLRELEKENA
jgi:hypothetical protein